ncbi:sulfite exporter TauE/SafE family protein [Limnoglobus roseus]|uniref:Probable membrane transporter protein n=1 Tax=Limnoglobus roseus TaxID=2598579 RepID=A0A5C1AFY7_9BACT|nr:sulfite exporter TauE/SafE family protein [Limnoglobus roseus]QEL16662.1 sulfite exporter TauE/SafE family protein [Limnoglobus roseus]
MAPFTDDPLVLPVVGVVFLATLVRSAFGFGEALVAVPLLGLIVPIRVAVPLATLLSIAIAALILAQDWRHIHVRSAWWLTLPTFVGIPIGLFLLTEVSPGPVKVAMAAVIIGFSCYCLFGRRKPQLSDDRFAWAFGFGAGILGGAYGMNGPPLVVYAALRGWSPEHFRATLQGYFLPASAAGMLGFWLAGLWVPDVTRYFLLSIVPAAFAVLIGRVANRRMHPEVFVRYVHVGLIGIGLVLLAQSVWGE